MKRFLGKHTVLCSVLAFLLIFTIFGTISVLSSRRYTYTIYHDEDERIEGLSMQVEGGAGLEMTAVVPDDTQTDVILSALAPGEGKVELHYQLVRGEERIESTQFFNVTVSKTNMIFVGNKIFDYAGFPIIYYGLMVYFGLMAGYFFAVRYHGRLEDYYSFAAVSRCAAGLLFSVLFWGYLIAVSTALFWGLATSTDVLIMLTRNLMLGYSLLTVPFMVVFSVSLMVSNVDLIRHEGGRPANMLGIALGLLLAVGVVLNVLLFLQNQMGDSVAISVVYSVYSAGYSILQTLLLGAVISCLQAARRKLPYGKQYIVILGCRIRKDGTLYPLLRGRVDRAIEFWRAQYESTGERAVFVPSGGQGSDECMAEAEAMERYLVEKGIPQELILPEKNSTSTIENMRFSKELIEKTNQSPAVIFSTTNYHVFRSGNLARQAGLKADGIGSKTKWYFWPNAMLREVVGMFAAQRKVQWLVIAGLILLAGVFGYVYTLIA